MKLALVLAASLSLGLFSIVGEVMLPATHLACLMPSAEAQDLPLPPDGNPDHAEPPPGANCKHDASDPSHNCACHRACRQNTDDEGNPIQGQTVQEDPKCRVWCYKSHCHCPIENCELS